MWGFAKRCAFAARFASRSSWNGGPIWLHALSPAGLRASMFQGVVSRVLGSVGSVVGMDLFVEAVDECGVIALDLPAEILKGA